MRITKIQVRLIFAFASLIHCLISASTAKAQATLPLESRLGGLAYYDPNLDISWVADANINGLGDWQSQTNWASGLVVAGVSGWRLPNANVNGDLNVVNCAGGGVPGCEDNEMGYLAWERSIFAGGSSAPFTNVSFNSYWSSTDLDHFGGSVDDAFWFSFAGGTQGTATKTNATFATFAVHDGDVGTPGPAAAPGLSMIGLTVLSLGLLGLVSRQIFTAAAT